MVKKSAENINKAIENAEVYEIDPSFGLNDAQIEERRKAGLSNKSPKKVTKTYWQIFCDNIFSFLNILLFTVLALMISAGLDLSYFLFIGILSLNIIIGLVTDIRARIMVDKLRLVTAPKATVIRNGAPTDIDPRELVLSDIVVLEAGDQICADSIVVSGSGYCDESLLTGESEPQRKEIGSEVFSGSYLKSGKLTVRLIKVGNANYAEGLQSSAKKFSRPKSEIKRSCGKIFTFTGIFAAIVGIMYLVTWLVKVGGNVTFEGYRDGFVIPGGSAMVAMTPTGLSLLFSVSLATAVIRLAQKRMNVQELFCIEMLARVDVVCFDKTGTLTEGTLEVKEVKTFGAEEEKIKKALGALVKTTGDKNATAEALRQYSIDDGVDALGSVAFDSANKHSAVTLADGTYILGASEFILAKLTDEQAKLVDSLSLKGYRVLCVAYNKKPISEGKIPTGNKVVAILALIDKIKESAARNIKWFVDNGVIVKVISGDDPRTVSEIACAVGVPNGDKYINMDGVKDEDIPDIVDQYAVFGRVKPDQKGLLVQALQAKDHKVAMTGDGVNDIVALKRADCSIAMASGSPAARNVAHIVSMDNDFDKLPDVVAEGRRVINNLQRSSSLFLTKTFFAIVLSVAFMISSWAGGIKYPFTTKNLMVWESAAIGIAGFFLALQPSRERLKGAFLANIARRSVPGAFAQILIVAVVFIIQSARPDFMSQEAAVAVSTLSFTALSFCILARICWPFDKYRIAVFGGMLAMGMAMFGFDAAFTGKEPPFLGFNFPLFGVYFPLFANTKLLLVACAVFVGVGGIYFLSDYLLSKILDRKEKKEAQNED